MLPEINRIYLNLNENCAFLAKYGGYWYITGCKESGSLHAIDDLIGYYSNTSDEPILKLKSLLNVLKIKWTDISERIVGDKKGTSKSKNKSYDCTLEYEILHGVMWFQFSGWFNLNNLTREITRFIFKAAHINPEHFESIEDFAKNNYLSVSWRIENCYNQIVSGFNLFFKDTKMHAVILDGYGGFDFKANGLLRFCNKHKDLQVCIDTKKEEIKRNKAAMQLAAGA